MNFGPFYRVKLLIIIRCNKYHLTGHLNTGNNQQEYEIEFIERQVCMFF